ncbi:sigma-70 family RNA polymerase sigma factor [Rhizobium bangladeshense]|uniref:sigma-70 family RNA polymerase sigma factor n=1 Tax=Rhizobium bangladeshense TaxID=1138189 RepID=UPI001C831864|nr:sigma-70 family RNA polymerase sigma factor [Rhizobium bangladeshense]MBX4899667.1 sigma-70 family RNA polymerase sigma factor [Rhizobium bangladeshense]MBY3617093.1 sigma-70 family RNA polymerase sigma factor [Rhizobium bangladeshense]
MTEDPALGAAERKTLLADLAREADALRPQLHRYAARLVGSVIDGEDVIQDAFARVFATSGSIPPGTPLRPWLFRIVHNRAMDALRQRSTRRSEPLEMAFDLADTSAVGPEDALIRRDTVRVALGHFADLPVPQRSAVILKDVLGESLADIAALLELSVDAVKAHLSRGRARLRTISDVRSEVAPSPSPEALNFAALFNAQDWDALRRLLADDVRLRQARRPEISGAADVGRFFTYYAEYPPVRVEPAWLEGREILLVSAEPSGGPSYFMLLEWRGKKISLIRDHRYATYLMDGADVMTAASW